jgi:hypothetical protein
VQAFDWAKQRDQIAQGEQLSPILIVREGNGGALVIADGFHRLCAVFAINQEISVLTRSACAPRVFTHASNEATSMFQHGDLRFAFDDFRHLDVDEADRRESNVGACPSCVEEPAFC